MKIVRPVTLAALFCCGIAAGADPSPKPPEPVVTTLMSAPMQNAPGKDAPKPKSPLIKASFRKAD